MDTPLQTKQRHNATQSHQLLWSILLTIVVLLAAALRPQSASGQASTAYQSTTIYQPRYAYQSTTIFQPTTILQPTDIFKSLTIYKTFPANWPNRGHPVNERPRAEFVPLGVPLNTWFLLPSLSEGIYFDSNLYSTSSNEVADLRSEFSPRVSLHSALPRHAFNTSVGVDFRNHMLNPEADYWDISSRSEGRLDLWHDTALYGSAEFGRFHDDLGPRTENASSYPIRYSLAAGQFSLNHDANRLGIVVTGAARRYDYHHGYTVKGAHLDQDQRDVDMVFGGLRLSYDLGLASRLFTSTELNRRVPRIPSFTNSKSWGLRTISGAEFTIGNLFRFKLGLGYMLQEYEHSHLWTMRGIAGQANIIWMPTDLLSLQIQAERSLEESPLSSISGRIPSTVGLRVDHEYARYLIGTSLLSYTHIQDVGRPNVDHHVDFSAQLRYFFNRNTDISLQYKYGYRLLYETADVRRHIIGFNVGLKY